MVWGREKCNRQIIIQTSKIQTNFFSFLFLFSFLFIFAKSEKASSFKRKTRLWPTIVQAIHAFSVKVQKLVNKLTLFLPSHLGFTVGCMSVRVVLNTHNAQLPKVHRK